ncbi:hypothetical protein J6590_035378 [Homalodisca vitripennis]|nr:hypothetical protein J6590_035378 [Homalodisca vitripennis]
MEYSVNAGVSKTLMRRYADAETSQISAANTSSCLLGSVHALQTPRCSRSSPVFPYVNEVIKIVATQLITDHVCRCVGKPDTPDRYRASYTGPASVTGTSSLHPTDHPRDYRFFEKTYTIIITLVHNNVEIHWQ